VSGRRGCAMDGATAEHRIVRVSALPAMASMQASYRIGYNLYHSDKSH
jgi:hypothetical protein